MFKKIIRKTVNKLGLEIRYLDNTNDVDHYIQIYGKAAVDKKKFYNIGAGSFYHPCWSNVEHKSEWYKKCSNTDATLIDYDLFSFKFLPIDTATAELVYTSHTIEHISDSAVQYFFNEAYRILKLNGVLRIITPNIDIEYRAWRVNDRDYFYWINDYVSPDIFLNVNLKIPLNQATISQLFLENFASTASTIVNEGSDYRITDDELENIFREMKYVNALDYCISKCSVEVQRKLPFHHINWFNKEKLFFMLNQAGFTNVHHSAYGQSISPVMRNLKYFDTTLPKVSLYVEAVK